MFQTFLGRKATHLFAEYFLASDSGRDSPINLHSVQLLISSAKTRAGSGERGEQNAFRPPGRGGQDSVLQPHPPPPPSRVPLTVSSRSDLRQLLSGEATLNGLTAHVTCEANTLRGWEAFQPGRHAENIQQSAQSHVSKASLVFHKTTPQPVSRDELIYTVLCWELSGMTPVPKSFPSFALSLNSRYPPPSRTAILNPVSHGDIFIPSILKCKFSRLLCSPYFHFIFLPHLSL